MKHHRAFCVTAVLLIGVAVMLAGCQRRYAYTSVPDGGMEPTIAPGTVVTVDFNAYKGHKLISRWDVIAFKANRTIMVKRVVGLPGETLKVDSDGKHIVVDGQAIVVPGDVPWSKTGIARRPADYPVVGVVTHVPEGDVYVLSDNPAVSNDSRNLGPIPVKFVTGKVLLSKATRGG